MHAEQIAGRGVWSGSSLFVIQQFLDTSTGNEWTCSNLSTVEPRYLELAYFELPLISKWKSGPCFNMKLWQQVTK